MPHIDVLYRRVLYIIASPQTLIKTVMYLLFEFFFFIFETKILSHKQNKKQTKMNEKKSPADIYVCVIFLQCFLFIIYIIDGSQHPFILIYIHT